VLKKEEKEMKRFYEEEVRKAQKQIDFAVCGFVGNLEECQVALEFVDKEDSHRKALLEIKESIDAILDLYANLDYNVKRFGEELKREADEQADSEASVFDLIREESVESLTKEGQSEC
jgi:hypothetical protein